MQDFILYLVPNVSQIQNNFEKFVKPLVERPFIPEEVDRLSDIKKKKQLLVNEMNVAQIVGDDDLPKKSIEVSLNLTQKPTLYSTVISSKKTTVIHPSPTPKNVRLPKEALYTFSSEGSQTTGNELLQKVANASVPVNLGSIKNDNPTMKGYETPSYDKPSKSQESKSSSESTESFFQKKEVVKSKFDMTPEEVIKGDITTFLDQFKNTRDVSDKVNVMVEGKNRLLNEINEIKETLLKDIDDLMGSKKLAIRLNNLVHKYEKRAQDAEQAKLLRLADEITVKDLIKEKIHREIQGLRSSPTQFQELEMVNKDDISRVTKEVLNKLGQF